MSIFGIAPLKLRRTASRVSFADAVYCRANHSARMSETYSFPSMTCHTRRDLASYKLSPQYTMSIIGTTHHKRSRTLATK
eukprot:4207597-Pyramimonas_sp.AAC.1